MESEQQEELDTPNYYHAESAVIGAVLSELVPKQDLQLTPEHFRSDHHRMIFHAIDKLAQPNILSVSDYLTANDGHKWMPDLIQMCDECFGRRETIEIYARCLDERLRIYQAKTAVMKAERDLLAGDFEAFRNQIAKIKPTNAKTCSKEIGEAVDCAIIDIEKIANGETGIKTGLARLDKTTGGLHDTDLVIIGARPGTGKTALMIQLATECAMNGIPVGVISTEQGSSQIAQRVMATMGMLSVHEIRTGKVDLIRAKQSSGVAKKLPMKIMDSSAPTMSAIREVATEWKDQGVRAVFVDYLQRLSGDSALPKHERVGQLAQQLKSLALDLAMPVVCLAQINRQAEARSDRKPRMSDLRDSGEIEQEADQILLLWTDQECPDHAQRWDAEILLDKNRHGPVGLFRCMWDRARMRFEEKNDEF